MAHPSVPPGRRQRWRRRLGATAAVVVFLAVALATLAFGYTTPVRWQVASVGADGHSLDIRVYGPFDSCSHTPFVDVSSADDQTITLRVRNHVEVYCAHPTAALFLGYAPLHVDVGQPIRGQDIRGASKRDVILPQYDPRRLKMPRVVGLAEPDARTAIRKAALTGAERLPAHAYVVRQDPNPGRPTDRLAGGSGRTPRGRLVPVRIRLTWSDGTTTTTTAPEAPPADQ